MKSGSRLDFPSKFDDLDGLGRWMHKLATRLWPIPRSITGPGVRETLEILREHVPALAIKSIPTGTKCFDWTVPEEWSISEAHIEDDKGHRIVDFAKNNLHVVGYSTPIDEVFSLEELHDHLHSLPDQPNAIPYVTSYYSRRWGFCITEEQRRTLKPGRYRAVIRSKLEAGVLNYAEIVLPGETDREILLSTYVCHPSMANNELSGPVVTTLLVKWLTSLSSHKYTYRIAFVPETIGSIAYLSMNLAQMKARTVGGYVITCIGDDRAYSFMPSLDGNSPADLVATHVLSHMAPNFRKYSFIERGSDERQYCSPRVGLPIASVMRSKYGEYPEYHTSLDDLTLVTPEGLAGGFLAYKRILECFERNCYPMVTVFCEPQLGKRGLYPTLSTKESSKAVRVMMNLIAYSDGTTSLLDIANKIGEPMWELLPIVERLAAAELLLIKATPHPAGILDAKKPLGQP